jgi:hypothetical protein
MQELQIRAQFRFNDGDKTKGKYTWERIPMDSDGNIVDDTYEPKCLVTGAQKAVDFETIELPSEREEFDEIPREVQDELIVESLTNRAKKKQADSLRESYESPQQTANRQKREKAAYLEYLGEKMEAFSDANPGEMPPAAMFESWKSEAKAHASK